MIKNLKHIIIFYLLFIVIENLLIIIQNNSQTIINFLYKSPGLFILYLFLLTVVLPESMNNHNNSNSNVKKFKLIFITVFLFIVSLSIINGITFYIYKINFNYIELLNIVFQFTIIFCFIEVILFFYIKKDYNGDSKQYLYLFLVCLLYILQYLYGNNIVILNFFKCYLVETNMYNIIIHYLIWGIILYVVFNYKKKKNVVGRKL